MRQIRIRFMKQFEILLSIYMSADVALQMVNEINLYAKDRIARELSIDINLVNSKYQALDIQYEKLVLKLTELQKMITEFKNGKNNRDLNKDLIKFTTNTEINDNGLLLGIEKVISNKEPKREFVYKALPYQSVYPVTTTTVIENKLNPINQVTHVEVFTPHTKKTTDNSETLSTSTPNDAKKETVENPKSETAKQDGVKTQEVTVEAVQTKEGQAVETPQDKDVQTQAVSQEETATAHEAVSAYKETVNTINAAGLNAGEIATVIANQVNNLSDIETSLGNGNINKGAVSVLKDETEKLQNLIWNQSYAVIEDYNLARNNYNLQIQTQEVEVDQDIETILSSSQKTINQLDSKIGARQLDSDFVNQILSVKDMTASLQSRTK